MGAAERVLRCEMDRLKKGKADNESCLQFHQKAVGDYTRIVKQCDADIAEIESVLSYFSPFGFLADKE